MSVSTNPNMPNHDRNAWITGFKPQAEIWNGRFAMLGFVAALITELVSGEGVLHFYNLIETVKAVPPM